jgi:hypothetical protein
MLRKIRYAGAGVLVLALMVLFGVAPVGNATRRTAQTPFADPAFRQVWVRNDQPVAAGQTARAWTWGPQPLAARHEPYGTAGATRLVQYFDKSRMEINNPAGHPTDPFFVTQGRLVVELISGRIQAGPEAYENTLPAEIPIAGDVIENAATPYPVVGGYTNALTYAGLYRYASIGGTGQRAAQLSPGTPIHTVLDRYGNPSGWPLPGPVPTAGGGPSVLDDPRAAVAQYVPETGHNVARAFWEFMRQRGPVYVNGRYVVDQVFDWVYVLGYPITEPYWTGIRISGRDYLVLIQAFERRVLTYNPANPPGWEVEMGNVGRHYQDWRYAAPHRDCPTYPLGGIGQVWAERPPVGLNVGCPVDANEAPVRTAIQHFEHGTMVWLDQDPDARRTIYVLFDDGSYERYDDTWEEGQSASQGLTPPPGRYEPVRGFGKLWHEGTGARIRERLGWATDLEVGGPGTRQQFSNGLLVRLDAVRQILVLYVTSPYAGPLHRAQFYLDTFTR